MSSVSGLFGGVEVWQMALALVGAITLMVLLFIGAMARFLKRPRAEGYGGFLLHDLRFGADGMLSTVTIRGFTPKGDAGETFAIENGKAHWKSPVDEGSSDYKAPAMYAAFGGTFDLNALMLERLFLERLAAQDRCKPYDV